MNQFEASIILWIQENLRGAMNGFWTTITHLGDDGRYFILLGILLLLWKKTRPIGFTVLISLLLDYVMINVTLKELFARPRPFVVNEAIIPLVRNVNPYRSFPSGHSGVSFAAMFAVYRWTPKKVGIPALVLAAVIALSRLYVGVHYPTDIITGCIIGFMCSAWAYYIVTQLKGKLERRKIDG